MIMQPVHWMFFILTLFIIGILAFIIIVSKQIIRELSIKLNTMNDYLRTLATQHSENLQHGQAVFMMEIFMMYAKYKIYSDIMGRIHSNNHDSEEENLFIGIKVLIDGVMTELRNKLGVFRLNGRYLSEYLPKDEMIEGLVLALEPLVKRKTGNVRVKMKSQAIEIKKVLSDFFDAKMI